MKGDVAPVPMTPDHAEEFIRVWTAMHGDTEAYENEPLWKSLFDQSTIGSEDTLPLCQPCRTTAIVSGDAQDDFPFNRAGQMVIIDGNMRSKWTDIGTNLDGDDLLRTFLRQPLLP